MREQIFKSVVFWGIGFVMLGCAVWVFDLAPGSASATFPVVVEGTWQAVFLTNDQVYFGKINDYNDSYITLSDVYYLRTASDLSGTGNLNLIKLGGELHGPDNMMYIPKESVLFWENMKDTSRVVQTINSARQPQQ